MEARGALGDGGAGGAGGEEGEVGLTWGEGLGGAVELVEDEVGSDAADQAAAVDELAGGDVDVIRERCGGGDLEASEEGAVAVVSEAGEDALPGSGGDRVRVLGGDHGEAEAPGETGGGGGRVEADLAGPEAAGEEGGDVEGAAGAHGRPVVDLKLLRGGVGGVLAGDPEARPELIERGRPAESQWPDTGSRT